MDGSWREFREVIIFIKRGIDHNHGSKEVGKGIENKIKKEMELV